MDNFVVLLFAVVIVVGIVLLVVLGLTRKHPKALDHDKFRTSWMQLQGNLDESNKASWQVAVMEADKLLDRALRERGTPGNTLAERLKSCSQKFSDLNGVWQAHKVRNRLAHESDVELTYAQTRKCLDSFRQGLKDIGAI